MTGSRQPSKTARLTSAAEPAAAHAPTYGTKRSTPASTPNRSAYGAPIRKSPVPMAAPKPALISDCIWR